jgi:D-amino-acid dehydrogenase
VSRSILVVGGGLIGLSTALLLSDRGMDVTVVDRGDLGGGAARGNAGFLCTTLIEPMASPGVVRSALRSLHDPVRPLRVHPRALPGMLGWGLHFARASTSSRYAAGRQTLAGLNGRQGEALDRFRSLGVRIDLGPTLVVPFKNQATAERYLSTLAPMADLGAAVPDGLLDGDELRRLVPALGDAITAGYVMSEDHSIDPREFVDSMIETLRERGVAIHERAPIASIERMGSRISSVRAGETVIRPDEVILAAGAGIRPLARKFGARLAVIPGQGYNVALPPSATLTHPVIFEEAHVVATPFADRIRLGGTMEFDGDEPRFDRRRIDAIVESMRTFLDLDLDANFDPWSGGRPMTPDGLPLLGRPHGFDNLVVAGGHGMFGLSLAPATALALSELIVDGRSSTDLSSFHPDRFGRRRIAG